MGTPEGRAFDYLAQSRTGGPGSDIDRAAAIDTLRKDILRAAPYGDAFKKELQDALKLLESGQHVGPHTYEVGIRARPEDLLDWDAPIAQQPEAVRRLAPQKAPWGFEPKTGADVYKILKYDDKGTPPGDAARASAVLRDAGIPGHRFLDQGSRGRDVEIAQLKQDIARTSEPDLKHRLERELELFEKDPITSNYVIYEPNILDILKRYAVPGAVPAAGLAAALTQDEPPPRVY